MVRAVSESVFSGYDECSTFLKKGKQQLKKCIDGGRVFGSDGRFRVSDPLVFLEGKINMTEFLSQTFCKRL